MKARGFTLLEMVVTVFIFGVVGVLAVQILSQTVRTSEKVVYRSSVLGEWHRAMNILEHDLVQLNHRGIRDEQGDFQPGVLVDSTGGIEFTRSGWHNILGQPRSDLQRVSYFLYGDQLYRRYWDVLDRSQTTQAVDQLLLSNVHTLEFEVIDRSGREHYFWPPAAYVDDVAIESPLLAVRMTLGMVELGTVSQLWLVPENLAPRQEIPST